MFHSKASGFNGDRTRHISVASCSDWRVLRVLTLFKHALIYGLLFCLLRTKFIKWTEMWGLCPSDCIPTHFITKTTESVGVSKLSKQHWWRVKSFYVHGSVHRWSILIIVQRDATQSNLFVILRVHSTWFRCQSHPSSGVHKTVTTASGTGHNFCAALSLQRGKASLAILEEGYSFV